MSHCTVSTGISDRVQAENRVYIHTTLHILKQYIHTYATSRYAYDFGSCGFAETSTHDVRLSKGVSV